MKVLFATLHYAHLRNFDSVVRELAARGHQVHLADEEPEALGGQPLVQELAASNPSITWDRIPSLEHEGWFDVARRMRESLTYVRALDPRYPDKLRVRAEERTSRIVHWSTSVPGVGRGATQAALTQFERLLPASADMVAYLRQHAPDVVVVSALTYARSRQHDLMKAARALNIPVAAAILSWDHLSSKALVHVAPDMVLVWNERQRQEAVEMHGLPGDRVVPTGAQCYDHWFTRKPERTREAFCEAMGLRPDRPFVLWVHSALTPTPDPPEPHLVVRWLEALRAHPDPALRELGVLVRPHPERMKEWKGIRLDRFENVAFHGRNPIDRSARDDYFDSLYHSAAVIGLVTSAFLEAAIVGRQVLTVTLPEYRLHQEEMIHFQYLTEPYGGPLLSAPTLEAHFGQLAAAVATAGTRDERNRAFLHAFVRPGGLDTPATPAFVDALERLHREGAHAHTPPRLSVLQWAVVGFARVSRGPIGGWLVRDARGDALVAHRMWREVARLRRVVANERHQRRKAFIRGLVAGRDTTLRAAKVTKSLLMRARHRTAVTVYRTLHVTGIWRGELPGHPRNDE